MNQFDINFESFKAAFGDMIVKDFLIKDLEEKTVKNPCATEKLQLYISAVSKLKQFLKDGRGKALVDPPSEPWNYHAIFVELEEDSFNASEIKEFAEIMTTFDSMDISGNSTGDITFHFVMEDLYVSQ